MSAVQVLNSFLETSEATNDLEAFTERLSISLQEKLLASQDGLEKLALQMPRVASTLSKNLSQTRTGIQQLTSDVNKLENNLSTFMASSSEVVQRIRATETVRNRLHKTYLSLESQDNWEALIANIKDVIASGDLDMIAGRMVALQKCFVSLKDAANHEERKNQLEDVKNKMEITMIPRLTTALSSVEPWNVGTAASQGSEGLALKIVTVFRIMERNEIVKRVLNECRLKQFVKHFEDSVKPLEESSVNAGTSLDECIGSFYDDLLSAWHVQFPLFTATFLDANVALLQHYEAIFSSINSKTEQLLNNAWKRCDSPAVTQDFLAMLLETKRSQEIFCKTIEKEFDGKKFAAVVENFIDVVRKPLTKWMTNYPDVEKVIIFSEINKIQLDVVDRTKSFQILSGAGNRLGGLFYASVVRCFQLTDGNAFERIMTVILEAVKTHLNKTDNFTKNLFDALRKESIAHEIGETNFDGVNDFVKIMHHYGELVIQMENVSESLRHYKTQNEIPESPSFAVIRDFVQRSVNTVFQQVLSYILQPVEKLLEGIPQLPSWIASTSKNGVDIPSFGLDPQEYITRIGNYLLTLPQMMDPLLSSDSPSIRILKNLIQFTGIVPPDESISMAEATIQTTIFMAMEKVTVTLIKIRHPTSFGVRQLVCDLRYMQNVVEDFAVPLSVNFVGLITLLSCNIEEWDHRKDSYPAHIVAFVAKARNIDEPDKK